VIAVRSDLKVLIASRPIDFRKGIHGLVALVAEALKADPYCQIASYSDPHFASNSDPSREQDWAYPRSA
jgi:hypothetical protein